MEKIHIYIDIRRREEYAVGHIPGARNIDFENNPEAFIEAVTELLSAYDITLYCYSSFRSSYAQSLLATKYNIQVDNMIGGLALYQGPLEVI
jgi:rhodanese-related sulfurtransferase